MSVMSTSGYGGATIPLIAKAAGLSTGLVHYHFDTKQSILLELVRHLIEIVDERFQSSKESEPAARLIAYIDAHLAYGSGANSMAVSCWNIIGAEAVNQPAIKAAYQAAMQQQVAVLEKVCEDILRAEGRSISKKREIALGITAAIEGSYRLLIAAPDMIPHGFAATTVRDMALGLISAQPASSQNRRT